MLPTNNSNRSFFVDTNSDNNGQLGGSTRIISKSKLHPLHNKTRRHSISMLPTTNYQINRPRRNSVIKITTKREYFNSDSSEEDSSPDGPVTLRSIYDNNSNLKESLIESILKSNNENYEALPMDEETIFFSIEDEKEENEKPEVPKRRKLSFMDVELPTNL
ncbi:hypothetical protein ABK040_004116 [Willaertia magna]